MAQYDLSRFIQAHRCSYATALSEIRRGYKTSHWMWYIFPQVSGLGTSSTSKYYAIKSLGEAWAFAHDPYLGGNLREITQALLDLGQNDATEIFGFPDDVKLRSCMTLFAFVCEDNRIFWEVLDRFFGGERDVKTQEITEKMLADLRQARKQAVAAAEQDGAKEEKRDDE